MKDQAKDINQMMEWVAEKMKSTPDTMSAATAVWEQALAMFLCWTISGR
jgi:hypothetical protein